MLAYHDYLKQLQNNVNKVRRLRTVLLIVLPLFCALVLAVSSLLFFYGTITEDVECPDFFIGDTPTYAAKAFLCEPEYLFYKEGQEDTASAELPAEIGLYVIEAVGGSGKGERRHSKANFAVLPLSLTVKPAEGTCSYGEQSRRMWCSGLAEGDCVVSCSCDYRYRYPEMTVEITPNVAGMKIEDSDGNDVTSHYQIIAETVSAPVEKAAVSVGFDGACCVPYDGEAHTFEILEVIKGELAPGDKLEYDIPEPQYSKIGRYSVRPDSVRIVSAEGEERTAYYDITLCDIELSVEKRKLIVTSPDAEVPYFQMDTYVPSYSVGGDGLLPGHRLTVTFDPLKKAVGTQDASFAVSVTEEKTGVSVTDLYEMECIFGKVDILPETLTVQTGSATKTYDGMPMSCPEFELVAGNLAEGHRLELLGWYQPTYAGQYDNTQIIAVLDQKGNDVSKQYFIDFRYGILTIQPAEITIRSLDYTKEYDGTELYGYEYELVSGAIYDDVYFMITSKSSQTEIGKTLNLFSVAGVRTSGTTPQKSTEKTVYWKNGSYSVSNAELALSQLASSYLVRYEYGTLEVTRGKLIITGCDAQKRYDGTPLTCRKYNLNVAKLPKYCYLDAQFSGTITEIGSTDNPFYAVVRDQSGADVTDQYFYEVQKQYGTLTVYKDFNEGSGAGGGGGASQDGDVSPSVSEKPDIPDLSVVFRLKSDYQGLLYLKNKDYNLYAEGNWTNTASLEKYYSGKFASPNNPLGFNSASTGALQEMTLYSADGEPFDCHLFPEYVYLANYYQGNISDTMVLHGKNNYSFRFFQDGQTLDKFVKTSGGGNVAGYRSTVERVYCGLNDAENIRFAGLQNSDPKFSTLKNYIGDADALADQIARYLGSICSYTLDFPEVPAGRDPVMYFLTESHRGVCNHFASAATLMCRYFGLPARYTTGYVVFSESGEETEILANQAHAWCEYYDTKTYTWKVLEATKYAPNLDGEDSVLGGIFRAADQKKIKLTVTVRDAEYAFDGREHHAEMYDVKGTLRSGDKLFMDMSIGSQMYVGSSACSGVPTVYIASGKDVTADYDITVIPGTVTVTPYEVKNVGKETLHINDIFAVTSSKLLGFSSESVEFEAVGLPETVSAPPVVQKYPLPSESGEEQFIALLPRADYRMGFELLKTDLNGDGTDEFTSKLIPYDISIVADTTVIPMGISAEEARNMAFIPDGKMRYVFGESDTVYRMLDIGMLSGERSYNGEVLTVNSCAILGGSLRPGEVLTCVGRNGARYAGEYKNNCASVYIFNREGIDVTSDYLIRAFEGTLRILPVSRTLESGKEYVSLFAPVNLDARLEDYSGICTVTDVQVGEGVGFLRNDLQLIPYLPLKKDVSLESGCDLNQDGTVDLYLTEKVTYVSRLSWWQIAVVIILFGVPVSLAVIGTVRKKRQKDAASAEGDAPAEEDAG